MEFGYLTKQTITGNLKLRLKLFKKVKLFHVSQFFSIFIQKHCFHCLLADTQTQMEVAILNLQHLAKGHLIV